MPGSGCWSSNSFTTMNIAIVFYVTPSERHGLRRSAAWQRKVYELAKIKSIQKDGLADRPEIGTSSAVSLNWSKLFRFAVTKHVYRTTTWKPVSYAYLTHNSNLVRKLFWKKIVHFDMDNVLVDFPSPLKGYLWKPLQAFEGRLAEVPGILMGSQRGCDRSLWESFTILRHLYSINRKTLEFFRLVG